MNSDFSQGRKGFTTSYKEYQSGKPEPGLYTITNNPVNMNGLIVLSVIIPVAPAR